ncbi:putative cuticle protein [Operophtera brumata]|uniref:Putative cuticle protein n=1 Tax=Operophtera brumata TaxID=104452 RepID=A0A0L7LPE9_OPEBR|nr:putative cuticle protein [Operophtera brumata]
MLLQDSYEVEISDLCVHSIHMTARTKADQIGRRPPSPSYQFGFDVNDDQYTNYQNRKEQRDGDVIKGSYSVVDSDGFIRTVTYTADPKEGFKAEILTMDSMLRFGKLRLLAPGKKYLVDTCRITPELVSREPTDIVVKVPTPKPQTQQPQYQAQPQQPQYQPQPQQPQYQPQSAPRTQPQQQTPPQQYYRYEQ